MANRKKIERSKRLLAMVRSTLTWEEMKQIADRLVAFMAARGIGDKAKEGCDG